MRAARHIDRGNPTHSFHARAGVGSYWTKLNATTAGVPITLKDRHTEFYWSAGLGWRFASRFTAIAAIDSAKGDEPRSRL
jgi:hypothetical protein